MTDFSDPRKGPVRIPKHVNRERNETYYWQNGCLYALSLEDLSVRPIFVAPRDGRFSSDSGVLNVGGGITGAGGKAIYIGLTEDLSRRIFTRMGANYVGFEETFAARPLCIILRIDLDTGRCDKVWEERCWVGHINPSPTLEGILTFCHEGPWDRVDHRIWVLDTGTGKAARLRPRRQDGEMIGHEYWLQDGKTVGYQVHIPDPGGRTRTTWTGFIRYDGTGEIEALNGPMQSPDHVFSLDTNMIVTDAGKAVKLIRREGARFDAPRVLCMHDSSFYFQDSHPHPCFTPDGKRVLYASDIEGYINLYLAEIPDYESLPYLNAQK